MIFKESISKYKFLFLVIILLHLLLLSNTQFTLWPEMVVYPYLANNGFLNYRDIINPYPPALTLFLEYFSKFFGYEPLSYNILTWILILITDFLIFTISLALTRKTRSALVALIFFVVFSVPFGINGLWFDLVQAPLLLSSLFYLLKFLEKENRKSLLASGFLAALAFFVKQNSIVILVWFIVLLIGKFKKKTSKLFSILGLFLLPSLTLLTAYSSLYFLEGTLDNFYYWTFFFPFFKASGMPGYVQFPTIRQFVIICSTVLIFIPVIMSGKSLYKLILATAMVMLIFAYPRFDFFHLIPSLSLLAILAPSTLICLKKVNLWVKPIIYLSSILLLSNTFYYLSKSITTETRFFEKEIYTAANYLKQSLPDKKYIYIQNGPDQLLPLSGKLPPKPWADEFPWYLELQQTQNEILKSLSSQPPEYIIYKPYDDGDTYEIGSYRPQKIGGYLESSYENYKRISNYLWLKKRID